MRYTKDIDLVFSPDDGGWYAHSYSLRMTTAGTYPDASTLAKALDANDVTWEP